LGPLSAVVVSGFAAWTRIEAGHGVLLSVVKLRAVLAVIAAAVLVRGNWAATSATSATSATMVAVVVSIFAVVPAGDGVQFGCRE
jgi:hypothetical protein